MRARTVAWRLAHGRRVAVWLSACATRADDGFDGFPRMRVVLRIDSGPEVANGWPSSLNVGLFSVGTVSARRAGCHTRRKGA